MKTCMTCEQPQETPHGLFCPRCATIQDAYVVTTCRVLPGDLRDFAELLRGGSVNDLKRREGAWVLLRVINILERLSLARKLDPDSIRVSLATRLLRQVAYHAKVEEYDREHGEGACRRGFHKLVGESMATVTTTPH
jgi:hypothetical protein